MATVASTAEMALDFSKTALEKRDDVPPSPSPSLSNSDGESSHSASVSDGHQDEREASTVATVKPLKAPKLSPGGGDKSPTPLSPGHENGSAEGDPAGMRPFKVYPFEHMPMFASNPLAAAAGSELYNAYAAATMPYGLAPGLLDSAMLTSPLNNYFSRRRRSNNSGNTTTITSTSTTTTNVSSSSSSPVPTSPVLGTHTSLPSTAISNGTLSSGDSDSECGSAKRAKLGGGFPGEEKKDEAYWERRRKNNEAAKRSRDARRAKEEEIAMRAAFLEQENLKLRAQVAILKNETAKLHYMLYSRSCS